MCGRFVLASSPASLAERFSARCPPEVIEGWRPSWNLAPSRDLLGLSIDREGERVLGAYRWGLVPSWAKDPSIGSRLFNARAESLARKPAFRAASAERRLVVVADGFYEWGPAPGGGRQPYYLRRPDGAPLALAGLWEVWRDPSRTGEPGAWRRTATIVTTEAGADVAAVHDRMPVVLPPDTLDRWLDRGLRDPNELGALCRPSPAGTLVRWPVDRRVGSVHNDDPSLIEPLGPLLAEAGPHGYDQGGGVPARQSGADRPTAHG